MSVFLDCIRPAAPRTSYRSKIRTLVLRVLLIFRSVTYLLDCLLWNIGLNFELIIMIILIIHHYHDITIVLACACIITFDLYSTWCQK